MLHFADKFIIKKDNSSPGFSRTAYEGPAKLGSRLLTWSQEWGPGQVVEVTLFTGDGGRVRRLSLVAPLNIQALLDQTE